MRVKIRPKVAALTAGIFVVLGIAAVLVEERVVLPSFAELERANAGVAMRRIDYALDLALEHVAVMAMDWGNWADTYHFVKSHNPTYARTNITNAALRQLNVNVLLIIDKEGRVVASRTWDRATDRPRALDLGDLKALPADFPWRAQQLEAGPVQGLPPRNGGGRELSAPARPSRHGRPGAPRHGGP